LIFDIEVCADEGSFSIAAVELEKNGKMEYNGNRYKKFGVFIFYILF